IQPPPSAPEVKAPISPRPPPPRGRDSMSSPPPDSVPPRSPQDERARRLALARKLGVTRSSMPPAATRISGPPPSAAAPVTAAAAAQELKRLRDASVDQGRRGQIRRYVESAEAQLKDNPAAAANAYRLALAMDPTNPDIIRAHEQASNLAAVA